jgi:cell division protein FtsQ
VAQRDNKTRSLVWEEDTTQEPRFRRAQPGVPLSGRGLPGMPLEMDDPAGDGPSGRSRVRKFSDAPRKPWWRPASPIGRIFLGAGALVSLCFFSVSIYAVKSFLQHDSRFRIGGTSNIQATGLVQVNRSEMLPVFGEDVGRNVFFVPLSERRKQLEQIPWIERATVMRLLPDQIRVTVVERKPVAFLRQGQQIGLVDANGVLLSMPPALMSQHHYSFPVVTGIDSKDPLNSRKARMAVYQRLVNELDGNGQHLSDQLSEIDLIDPEDARVLMPEQGRDILAHFGEDHFLDRYQRYKAHIAEWRQQYPKLAEVDLRYDQQVVLQMTPGANASPTTLSASDENPEATNAAKPPEKTEKTKTASPKHAQSSKTAKPHTSSKHSTKPKPTKSKTTQKKTHSTSNHGALNLMTPTRAATVHSTTGSVLGE